MAVPPDALKTGDIIFHKGDAAEVLGVRSWRDSFYGKIYGVDISVKGKRARVSFAASSQVEVWSGEAA